MIPLVEGDPPREFELTAEQAAALVAAGAVRIAPGPRAGLWRIRDNGYVGAATIGGVEVRIRPKTPIDRLLFLLGYSRSVRGWRQEEVNAGEHQELLPALAHAFGRAAHRALGQGVLQGYLEIEEASQVVRGRMRGRSYELDNGTAARVDGLLIEVWRVFEDFVTVALSEAFRPYGGRTDLQDRCHHLDHGKRVPLRPDLVRYIIDPDGVERPAAVVDAKYKISTGPDGHNGDLYQMLAYCTVLGLRHGHLVYAKGDADPYLHVVRRAGIEITQHALDLRLPPTDLLAAVEGLAGLIIRCGADRELVPVDPR